MPIKTAKTAFGKVQVYDNDFIGQQFLNGKHYELDRIETILKNVPGKRVAIDIGAHIGSHSIVYKDHFEKVYAFEPQSHLCELLSGNIGPGCIVYNNALGHINKQVGIEQYKIDSPVNYGDRSIALNGANAQMMTLDSFNLENVDLIKIDAEGAEGIILYGAQETIKKWKPTLFFETDQIVDFNNRNNITDLHRVDIFDFLLNECQYRQILMLGKKNALCVPRKRN